MIWGDVSVTGNVDVQSGVNDEFTFDVNGSPVSITIPQATYNTIREFHYSELVDKLQELFEADSVPAKIILGGIYDDNGKYNVAVIVPEDEAVVIDNIGGTFKPLIIN